MFGSARLRMRNISQQNCRENQNTCLMLSNSFSESRAVDEIMWESVLESDRPQMTAHALCVLDK
jgi:hypothetical protein